MLVGPAGTITLPGSLCTGGTHGSCGGIVGRLLADGSPDPSFGDAGRVRPTLRSRNAAELLADGRTIIGGAESLGKPTGSDFTLERLTSRTAGRTRLLRRRGRPDRLRLRRGRRSRSRPEPRRGSRRRRGLGKRLGARPLRARPRPVRRRRRRCPRRRDLCPERFSQRPSGCPKVERTLEVSVPANDRLAGRITSPTGACIAKQKVKVKRRVRHGPDRTVGHASTNARGEWRSHKRLGHGRFRAVAKRSIDPIAGRCNRARSRTVHA